VGSGKHAETRSRQNPYLLTTGELSVLNSRQLFERPVKRIRRSRKDLRDGSRVQTRVISRFRILRKRISALTCDRVVSNSPHVMVHRDMIAFDLRDGSRVQTRVISRFRILRKRISALTCDRVVSNSPHVIVHRDMIAFGLDLYGATAWVPIVTVKYVSNRHDTMDYRQYLNTVCEVDGYVVPSLIRSVCHHRQETC
jgi:hypothetical protein